MFVVGFVVVGVLMFYFQRGVGVCTMIIQTIPAYTRPPILTGKYNGGGCLLGRVSSWARSLTITRIEGRSHAENMHGGTYPPAGAAAGI